MALDWKLLSLVKKACLVKKAADDGFNLDLSKLPQNSNTESKITQVPKTPNIPNSAVQNLNIPKPQPFTAHPQYATNTKLQTLHSNPEFLSNLTNDMLYRAYSPTSFVRNVPQPYRKAVAMALPGVSPDRAGYSRGVSSLIDQNSQNRDAYNSEMANMKNYAYENRVANPFTLNQENASDPGVTTKVDGRKIMDMPSDLNTAPGMADYMKTMGSGFNKDLIGLHELEHVNQAANKFNERGGIGPYDSMPEAMLGAEFPAVMSEAAHSLSAANKATGQYPSGSLGTVPYSDLARRAQELGHVNGQVPMTQLLNEQMPEVMQNFVNDQANRTLNRLGYTQFMGNAFSPANSTGTTPAAAAARMVTPAIAPWSYPFVSAGQAMTKAPPNVPVSPEDYAAYQRQRADMSRNTALAGN